MKVPQKRELEQIASNHSSGIDFKNFMKLYKDYTKELNSLLANNTRKSITIQEELIIKMSISQKIKTTNNKIKQNKAQYDLDRQTAKI